VPSSVTPPEQAGLTSLEAQARLRREGPNLLPTEAPTPGWRQFAGQMVHFFALLLWAAGVLALIAGLVPLGLAIFLVILANGAFAFFQEHRAERAAARLRELIPQRVTVVRDGQHVDVQARHLVVGDVVVLAAGDRVPADLSAIAAHQLSIDTSTLTGESVPTAVDAGTTCFAGTFVVEGEGAAVVTATGANTRLAGIAHLTRAGQRPKSPLTIELHRLVRTIAIIAVGAGTLLFAVTVLLGRPLVDGLVLAIGITVALVPEGLLPTLTLSLALGAQRMAKSNALVRRLESVETLGSTTFICTDKTGTITKNEMAVVEVWTPSGVARITGNGYEPTGRVEPDSHEVLGELKTLAVAARRTSTGHAVYRDDAWQAQGDPMEAAIDVLARRVGAPVAQSDEAEPDAIRFAFDTHRRRQSVATVSSVFVKGAPDSVLALCVHTSGANEALSGMARRGLRVLAVAGRASDALPSSAEDAERDLGLYGLIGLLDPPRPEAAGAIAACRRAGVAVAMVTGDHPETARAIADQVGLLSSEERVIIGADLPEDDRSLRALVDHDGIVVARVAPEQKLRIAQALQHNGHVVAMTGDGVNDGPALQVADVGVAMGKTGSDVARDAADLVLLDDQFATIVVAIGHGRATFANIRRFLTYHLSDNVAEVTPFVVWGLSGGKFPLALGVVQVLALDLVTDTFSAVALGAERPSDRVLDQDPASGRLLDRTVAVRAFGVLGPVEAILLLAAFVASMLAFGWQPGEAFLTDGALLAASGAAFAAVVFGQSANAFACRSTRLWPGALGWMSNRLLGIAVTVGLLLGGALVFVGPLAALLDQAVPPLEGWLFALLAAPTVLAADALYKWLKRASVSRQ